MHREDMNGISINGQQLGMRDLEFDSKGDPVRIEGPPKIPLGVAAGAYELTGKFLIGEQAAELFDQICGTRSQQDPGEPKIEYREREGAIWRSAGGVQGVHINDLGPMDGKAWERLGLTRGPFKSDRMRKFVWRRGQLVEVRTRGRTGTRSLRAAIEAAGPPPTSFCPLVMTVDLTLRAEVPLITMQIGLSDPAPLLTCDVCRTCESATQRHELARTSARPRPTPVASSSSRPRCLTWSSTGTGCTESSMMSGSSSTAPPPSTKTR